MVFAKEEEFAIPMPLKKSPLYPMLTNANQRSKIRRPNAAKEKAQSRKTPAMPLHVNATKNSEYMLRPSLNAG